MKSAEKEEGKKKRKHEEETSGQKHEKREKHKREIKVKYVGETGRSTYERGVEHVSDYLNYDDGRHLLKHYLTCHQNIKMLDVRFGMKIQNTF